MPFETPTSPRHSALLRLGITEQQLAAAPQITPQLRLIQKTMRRVDQPRVSTRIVDTHGNAQVFRDVEHRAPTGPGSDILTSWPHYLAACDHENARRVLSIYYSMPGSLRKLLPVEAFCVAAAVSPLSILELIVGACVRFGAQASSIIAAVNHPRIVEKSVEMALTDEGIDDRQLLAKAVGFLPTPKGSQTTVNVTQRAEASANAAAQATSVAAPPPERTIRTLIDAFNEARGISPTLAAPQTLQITEGERDAITIPADAREPAALDASGWDDADADDEEPA